MKLFHERKFVSWNINRFIVNKQKNSLAFIISRFAVYNIFLRLDERQRAVLKHSLRVNIPKINYIHSDFLKNIDADLVNNMEHGI